MAAGLSTQGVPSTQWLEALASLIAEGLTLLTEAAPISRYLLEKDLAYTSDAIAQLRQPNVVESISAVAVAAADIDPDTIDLETVLKTMVGTVAKEQGVKKGLLMKSLRAALTGALRGPDLMTSFVLLHQRGWAIARLEAVSLLQ